MLQYFLKKQHNFCIKKFCEIARPGYFRSMTHYPANKPGNLTADELLSQSSCSQTLSAEEFRFLSSITEIKRFKKGATLLREGQIARACYFIFQGCVREYILQDGEEKTMEFYLEGDALSDDLSKREKIPTRQYWECLEDTTVSVFTLEKEDALFSQFPRLETVCRMEMEKAFAQYRSRMHRYLASTPEERYRHLFETRPALLERVPQYHLASYIGVKPESLSRIRARMRNHPSAQQVL